MYNEKHSLMNYSEFIRRSKPYIRRPSARNEEEYWRFLEVKRTVEDMLEHSPYKEPEDLNEALAQIEAEEKGEDNPNIRTYIHNQLDSEEQILQTIAFLAEYRAIAENNFSDMQLLIQEHILRVGTPIDIFSNEQHIMVYDIQDSPDYPPAFVHPITDEYYAEDDVYELRCGVFVENGLIVTPIFWG